jgi:NTP pyrophosphatase (non-canonical NTP hydrolase)
MSREGAVKAILKELDRATKKFPEWPTDPVHAAAVVGEEAGELTRAALQFNWECGPSLAMMDEAIQTGAMALRFLMHIDDYKATEVEQVTT